MSLRIYRLQLSLAIYLVLVTLVLFYKSDLTHDNNGNLKTFGIGSDNKTLLPLWLIILLGSIVSYYLALLIPLSLKK